MRLKELETRYNKKVVLKKPYNVAAELSDIRNWTKEAVAVFYLKTDNTVISREIISIGSLNSTIIHPREIYRTAIIRNANSIILAHNHPSGSAEPSGEDREVTKRIADSGGILGITLLDHVIVTKTSYYSMQQAGEV